MTDRKAPGAAPAGVALVGFVVFAVLVFIGIMFVVRHFL